MNNVVPQEKREYLSWLAVLLYAALCIFLLSPFKEIIDPDDTAYLKIADRYVSGDWERAINGMWSPLNSLIGALFISWTGIKGIMMFKYLNIAFGVICMISVRSLLQKSGVSSRYHFLALLGLVPFFAYATYGELAADWLQCTVLMLYINLICSKKYPEKFIYPVLCGIIGALAYYAKYYNFHFFWLHFILANLFWFYKQDDKRLQKKFWSWTATGLVLLVACSIPWILLIHHKYGFYKLNYTGVFDLSWSLDQQVLTKHTKALLQPTLPGAASFLEDPIWHKHEFVTPFTSWPLFRRQVAISMLAVSSFFEAVNEFSALFVGILCFYLFRFFKGGYTIGNFERSAMLVFLVMPSGYFLFHFESRFIWPLCLLGYVLGLKLIEEYIWPLTNGNALKYGVALFFVLTFCVQPVFQLFNNIQRDDEVTQWAKDTEQYHLQGSTFITNSNQNNLMRYAYLTNTSLSVYRVWDVETNNLIDDIHKFKVNYYFEFYKDRPLLPCELTSQMKEITGGKLPYVKIYQLY